MLKTTLLFLMTLLLTIGSTSAEKTEVISLTPEEEKAVLSGKVEEFILSRRKELAKVKQLKKKKKSTKKKSTKEKYHDPKVAKYRTYNKNAKAFRGHNAVMEVKIGKNDVQALKTCQDSSLYIALDPTETAETITDGHSSNPQHFNHKLLKKGRGIYVQPSIAIQDVDGQTDTWINLESSKDGFSYNFFIVSEKCKQLDKYPRTIYFKRKRPSIMANGKSISPDGTGAVDVLTPEDMKIQITNGYRIASDREFQVFIKDAVMEPGSAAVILSLYVVFNNTSKKRFNYDFIFLNNLKIQKIPYVEKFLKKHSKFACDRICRKIARFSVTVNVDKEYIKTKDDVWLYVLDNDTKKYKQIRIKTSKFFNDLKPNGYNLGE